MRNSYLQVPKIPANPARSKRMHGEQWIVRDSTLCGRPRLPEATQKSPEGRSAQRCLPYATTRDRRSQERRSLSSISMPRALHARALVCSHSFSSYPESHGRHLTLPSIATGHLDQGNPNSNARRLKSVEKLWSGALGACSSVPRWLVHAHGLQG